MVAEVRVVTKDTQGQVQNFNYKPGGKHPAKSNTIYKLVVDGAEQLPPGTKIYRKANNIIVEFADGQIFEFTDWCGVDASRLIDLDNVQALDANSAAYVAAKEIGSGACLIAGDAGQGAGALGEASQSAAAAAVAGGFSPAYLAPLALLGLAGGGGGGGGGGSPTPPAGPSGRLAALSDSGVQGDSITSDTTPTITGSGGTPGQTIELSDAAGNVLGTATVAADGSWDITPGAPLPEGLNNLRVVAIDAAGSRSEPVSLPITIDTIVPTVAPPSAAPDMTSSSDTGVSDIDNNTADSTPSFVVVPPSGAGETLILLVDGVAVPALFDAGTNTLTPVSSLPNGAYSVSYAYQDVAGNVTDASPGLAIAINDLPPGSPTGRLDPGSDTGISGDGTTGDNTPAISGTGIPGETITVTLPGGATLTDVVNADGTWQVIPTTPLADGNTVLSITATSPTGVVSAPFTTNFVIDTTSPSAPTISAVPENASNASINAAEAADGTTIQVGIPADAQAGDVLTLNIGGQEISYSVQPGDIGTTATVAVPSSTLAGLSDGTVPVTATLTDAAGNASAPSGVAILTLDRSAPNAPSITAVPENAAAINSAEASDGVLVNLSLPADAQAGDTLTVTLDDVPTSITLSPGDIAAGIAAINIAAASLPTADGSFDLTAQITDAAGNPGSVSTPFSITFDRGAPTTPVAAPDLLATSDSGASDTDNNTSDTTPSFAIAAPAAGETPSLYVDGVKVPATFDPATNTLTPIDPIPDGVHSVTTTLTDAAGNESPQSPALAVTIDTAAPSAPAAPDMTAGTDSGASNTDNITNDATPSFTGSGATPGETITLYVDGSAVGTGVVDGSGNWSIAPADPIADGAHNVTVTATDVGGNESVQSAALPIVIDTTATAAPSISAIPENSGGGINAPEAADGTTIQVSVPATAQAGDTLTLNVGGQTVSYTVLAGDVGATANVPVSDATLAALTDGSIAVTATLTDQAGNVSAPSAPFAFTLDRGLPTTPVAAPDLLATSDSGASDTDNNTRDTTPSFAIVAPAAGETPSLYVDGVKVPATFDALTNTLTPINPLPDGPRSITITLTDAAGNESAQSAALNVVIDTTAPAALAAPDMTAGTDTGASNSDNLTNDATPTFTGSGATPGETITLYVDGSAVGTGVVDGSGNWSITPADPIADGAHNVTVTTTDVGGNESAQSAALPIVIDTTATAAPSISAIPENSGGGINAAEAADGTTIQVSVPATAQAGDTLTLNVGGQTVSYTVLAGDVGATANVPVSDTTLAVLADGSIAVTATLTDQAGNVSAPSAPFAFTLDRGTPGAPTALDLIDTSDSGSSNTDNTTSDTTPTITGAPVEAGATVTLYDSDGTTVLGTTVADASGNWSITPSSVLADGVHNFTVKQTDVGGNQSAASAPLAVTIDTVAPGAPAAPDMTAGTDSGASNADDITSDSTPTFTGSGATPGETITLYIDGVASGTAVVAGDGSWSITPANPIAEGGHAVSVTTTDAAGNESPQSLSLPIVIDTTVPSAPAAPDMTAATDTGSSSVDNRTSNTTPSFTIPAPAAGETPNLYIDGVLVPSAFDSGTNTLTPTGPVAPGAHNVTTTVTDAAGNESAHSPALPIVVDTGTPAAPSALDLLTTSDTGTSTTDDVTSDTTPTITGAPVEGGATVTLYDSDGTTVLGTTVADASGNWSITSSGLIDGVHNFTAKQTDLAGNVSAAAVSLTVTIDTAAPAAPAAPDMQAASDTGANSDNDTSTAQPVFDVSAPAAGETVKLYVDGVLVPSSFNALNNTLTPLSPLADGAHSITYTFTDAAGNESDPSPALAINIDTVAPSAPVITAIPENNGGGVTSAEQVDGTTVEVSIPADAQAGDSLILNVGGEEISYTILAGDVGGTVSVIVPVAVLTTLGGTGTFDVTATVTDNAGNESAVSSAVPLILTNAALTSPIIADVPENAGGGINNTEASDGTSVTVDITGAQSSAGAAVAGDTLRVTINGVHVDVELTADNITDGFVNVNVANAELPVADGVYAVTAKVMDGAAGAGNGADGLADPVSPVFNITLDRTAPVAPATAPDMTAGTDTGGSNVDNNTNDTTPSFAIPAPGSGETPSLYLNGAKIAATFDSATNTLTPTSPIAEGAYTVTYTLTDAAGNESGQSPGLLNAVIDVTAPAAPAAPDMTAATDTGSSNTDDRTNDTTPSFSVAAPGVNETPKLYVDGVLVASVFNVGDNTLMPVNPLAEGAHNITWTITDAAGNESPQSAALPIVIDTGAPSAPAAPDMTAGTDTGSSDTDNNTNDTTPSFSGTGTVGETITLYVDGTAVGSAVVAGDGSWNITPAAPIAEGAHNVTATSTDSAGNESAQSPALPIIIDVTAAAAPTAPDLISASDSGASNTDNNTSDSTPTITGAPVGAGFTVTLYDTDGTTVLGTTVADAAGNWSITSSALADGVHNFSITQTDLAGNESAASATLPVTIDTTQPTAPAVPPDMTSGTDTGSSNADNRTSDTTPTFTGTGTAGETITLYVDGTAVGTAVVDGGGNWSIAPSATLGEGAHNVTSTTTDAAGNESAPSPALAIVTDTTAPGAPTITAVPENSNGGVNATEDDNGTVIQVSIPADAQAGDTLTLNVGGQNVAYTVLAGDVGATANVTVPLATLDLLADGSVAVTATLTDAAGNVSTTSPAFNFTLDRAAPTTPAAAPDMTAGTDSGASNTDNNTGDSTPSFTIAAPAAGETPKLYVDGVLVPSSFDAGSNTLTPIGPIADGPRTITYTLTDAAGNESLPSPGLAITIDTTAPAAPVTPDMTAATDSGSSNSDDRTSDATPTFTGSGGTVGETITLYVDGTAVGTGVVDGSGNWSITPSAPLADGSHNVTATSTDAAGNESVQSAALPIVIDTTAPSAPSVTAVPENSAGGVNAAEAGDGTTIQVAIPLDAQAGDTLSLSVGGQSVTYTVLGSDVGSTANVPVSAGTLAALADGTVPVTATLTDAAGNTSAPSAAFNFLLDRAAPSAPTALDLLAASDTGASNSDNVTGDTTPTISGAAVEPGATVTLYDSDGTTVLGTTVADASGNWSITSSALTDGVHNFTVKQTDTAGNVSAASAPLPVTIDTAAPSAPVTPDMTAATDSGGSNSDDRTSDATPTFTGSGTAGETITLYVDGTAVGTGVVDGSGNWSITPSAPIADGSHNVTATTTDAAGNESAPSAALPIVIDTTAPSAPSISAVPENSGGGVNAAEAGDGTTIQVAIPLNAQAGDTLTLNVGGQTLTYTVLGSDVGSTANVPVSAGTLAALADGTIPVTATLTDAAGNTSAPSSTFNFTLDRAAPNAPVIAAVPENAGGGINATEGSDGTTVTITLPTGTQAGDTLHLTVGGNIVDYVVTAGNVTAGASNVPVSAAVLAAAVAPSGTGTVNLTATITDAAGNTSSASPAFPINVDIDGPGTPQISAVPENTQGGINVAEAADGTTVNVSLAGTGAVAGDTLTLDWGGVPLTYTLTATDITNDSAGVPVSNSTITTRGSGTFNITSTLTDASGNVSPTSTPFTVKVDVVPPFAPTITAIPEASGGGLNAAEAADGTPVQLSLAGTDAQAGDVVTLDWGGETISYTLTADDITNGNATITVPASAISAAGDGTIPVVVAKITDGAGNPGPNSVPFSVVVDTTAPGAPTITSIPDNAGGGINASEDDDGAMVNISLPAGTAAGDVVTLNFGGQTITHTVLSTEATAGSVGIFVSQAILQAVAGGATGTANNVPVTATLTDQAGNVSVVSNNSPVNIDLSAPAALTVPDLADASDTGASNNDDVTGDTTPTIQGSGAEPNATITLYDSDGTTVLGTTSADGGGNWSITPAAALSAGVHNFTVKQTDTAGNAGPASPALAVTIIAAAPAPATPDMTAATDSGSSDIDNLTNDATPTFTVAGVDGNTINVFADVNNDGVFNAGDINLGSATVSGGVATITPSSNLADGPYAIRATQTDLGGNTSTASNALAITIDTTAPTVPAPDMTAATDSGSSSSDNITGDNTPTFTLLAGSAQSSDTVQLLVNGSVVAATVTVNGDGSVSATPTSAIADAASIPVAFRITDAAGNVSTSPNLNITVDTGAPAAAPTPDLDAPSDSGSSNTDNITNDTTPTFSQPAGTAPAGVTQVAVYVDGVRTLINVNGDGSFSFTPSGALSNGAHTIEMAYVDAAGNEGAKSSTLNFTIDTSAPSANVPDLVAASDSGSSNTDNLTSDNTPTLTVAGIEGSSMQLFADVNNDGIFNAGDIDLGSATVTGGVATVTAATLADGVYNVRAIETDLAGNVSAASGALGVTIDTAVPSVPAPDMTAATDSGSSSTDNITSDNTPTFTLPAGSAPAGATVQLLVNGSVVAATVTVNGDGSVTATPTGAIADGTNIPIAFRITDVADNVGTSSNLNITVDTSAPVAPPTPDLAAASDSGTSSADDLTNDTTPTLQGTGALANALITLFDSDGVTVIGTTTADGTGAWSFTPSVALGAGVHNFTAKQTDPAGNQSAASSALAVTIDIAGPSFSNPAALNEGFASITLNSITLSGTDNVTANGSLEVVSAVFKSSSTFVAGDFSFGAPAGGAIAVTRSGGADKSGTVVMTVQMRDAAGNITTQDITVNVTSVNDAPAGTDTTISATEDVALTVATANFGFTDLNDSPANNLQGVRITSAPAAGTLFIDADGDGVIDAGEAVTAGTTVSATDIGLGRLKYLGAANANGAGIGNFTFQVQDNGGTANGGVDLDASANTMTVNVSAVNDAPVNSAPSAVSVNEDASLNFTASNLISVNDPDSNVGQSLSSAQLSVGNGNLTVILSGSATISAGANGTGALTISGSQTDINATLASLKYQGVSNFNGSDTLTVVSKDGANVTDTDIVAITVNSVNDAPAGNDKTVGAVEDTVFTFSSSDFGFSDPVEGNTLQGVKISTVAAAGTLFQDANSNGVLDSGEAIAAGTTVSTSDIAASKLRFIGAANGNGTPYTTFTFQVQDNGGTANGGVDLDASANTITFNVTAVNDAPVNTKPGTVTVNEDTSISFSGGNLISVNDPDANVGHSLVSTQLSTGNGNLTVTLSGAATISAGANGSTGMTISGTQTDINATLASLKYQGLTNFSGVDTLTVTSKDGAGVTDTDLVAISVTPVADAPVIVPGTINVTRPYSFDTILTTGAKTQTTIESALGVSAGWMDTFNPPGSQNIVVNGFDGDLRTVFFNLTAGQTVSVAWQFQSEETLGDIQAGFIDIGIMHINRPSTSAQDFILSSSEAYVDQGKSYPSQWVTGTQNFTATTSGVHEFDFVVFNGIDGLLGAGLKVDSITVSGPTAIDIPLTVLGDQDGSEVFNSIQISGVPAGFTFNQGTDLGGGTWSFIQSNLSGLQLLTTNGFAGSVSLTATVQARESANGATATSTSSFTVQVENGKIGVSTTNGNDTFAGTASADYADGDLGNDNLSGAAGNDTIIGGAGTDTLNGGDNNDVLDGGAGADTLIGGNGNDKLTGGAANDNMTGGAGRDVYFWAATDKGTPGTPATDTITDFATGAGGDVLDLGDLLVGENYGNLANFLHFTVSGGNTSVHIASTGGYSAGYTATATDQVVVLNSVSLIGTDNSIIAQLLQQSNLAVI